MHLSTSRTNFDNRIRASFISSSFAETTFAVSKLSNLIFHAETSSLVCRYASSDRFHASSSSTIFCRCLSHSAIKSRTRTSKTANNLFWSSVIFTKFYTKVHDCFELGKEDKEYLNRIEAEKSKRPFNQIEQPLLIHLKYMLFTAMKRKRRHFSLRTPTCPPWLTSPEQHRHLSLS